MTDSTLTETFRERGFVILRQFFEPHILDEARIEMCTLVEAHAQKLLAEGLITNPLRDEPFETRLYQLYKPCLDRAPHIFRPELHLAGLYALFFDPRLLDIIEILLGPEVRLYPNYSCRPKLPDHAPTLILWHQDAGYTDQVHRVESGAAEDLRMVNVWTPLVPATVENGCMQFIPGTHRIGIAPHVKREYYLEIAEEYLAPRLADAVDIVLDPGDIVLFSNLLFHMGQPNRSEQVRWSFDWRYQDATQSTLRAEKGHIARSRSHPESAVASAAQWASISFT